jgi:thioredoxin-dependent peroxiredoxin
MIEQGERAPAMSVTGSDGAAIDLAAPGRPVVLFFYPKDDTSGCTREAQDFTALAGEFAAAGAEVVGASRDSEASHAKFTAKYALGMPLYSDGDGALSDAFGTWVQKSMYGRKYMGMERATFLVDSDGRIARAWRKVKVPGHAAEVLAAASALPSPSTGP